MFGAYGSLPRMAFFTGDGERNDNLVLIKYNFFSKIYLIWLERKPLLTLIHLLCADLLASKRQKETKWRSTLAAASTWKC